MRGVCRAAIYRKNGYTEELVNDILLLVDGVDLGIFKNRALSEQYASLAFDFSWSNPRSNCN